MDIIGVISKEFQAQGNCLWIYSGEENIEHLVLGAAGITEHQII